MGCCYNISFVGAGNVAEALAMAFLREKQRIISVSSRSGISARLLAEKTGAVVQNGYHFSDETDIVIISVNDSSIETIAQSIECPDNTIVLHTAGSVPLSILGRSDNTGVLYPLQTFTKGRTVNMKAVPFFIEATDEQTLGVIKYLAMLIGSSSHECVSERRKSLHIAAVFASNFPNFMMTISSEIVSRAGFNPGVLHPLIKETIGKAVTLGPESVQTGPARRNDTRTINEHLELLSYAPDYQDLYRKISEMIINYYNKNNL